VGDWIARALGTAGQMLPGPVLKISWPRTDLRATVQGLLITPALALTSYAAFQSTPYSAMVVAELALLDAEVTPVLRQLEHNQIYLGHLTITALHSHLTALSPHLTFLNLVAFGDGVGLATVVRQALGQSATPLGHTPAHGAPAGAPIDTARIARTIGYPGAWSDGVFTIGIARPETLRNMGTVTPAAMGVGMTLSFQPVGPGQAAVTGSFVLRFLEVGHVLDGLAQANIAVTALHNHALNDDPHLFDLHFWATGDALTLAAGLRAALDVIGHLLSPLGG
jgi:hypothetical protein